MMRWITFVLAMTGQLSACTGENEAAATSEAASPTPADGEVLLAAPPEGWQQVLSIDRPGLRMVEFVPEEEVGSGENWRRKISFESLAGNPLPDPIDVVTGLSADQEGTCGGFEAFSTFSGLENGYPTTVHLMVCHRNKLSDKSQVTMVKVIQGNEHFYVITRSERGPPLAEGAQPISEEAIAGWSLYLKAITVCDAGEAEHPCPTG